MMLGVCQSLMFFGMVLAAPASPQEQFASDVVPTSSGDLRITFIGHASLIFLFGGKTVYVDPYGKLADYGRLPKADLVLITHEHRDHLDLEALAKVRTERTKVVLTGIGATQLGTGMVLKNGDVVTVEGLSIEAVPAYNMVGMRENGQPFHPKGNGNGYIITFGNKRVYVAGDTENIPEMKALRDIDIAFLPMNLPYTMTPEMVADAARSFKPRLLYPYHTGETDVTKLTVLLKDRKDIEVRIRNMK